MLSKRVFHYVIGSMLLIVASACGVRQTPLPPTATPVPTLPAPTATLMPTPVPFKNMLVYDLPEMYQVSIETVPYDTLTGPPDTLEMDVFYPPDRTAGELLPAVILANDFPLSEYPEPGSRTAGLYQSWGRLIAASDLAAVAYSTMHPDDLEAVVQHLQQHGAELGIDADRLGLWSCSSNVAMASSFAYQPDREYLKFAVFYYGTILMPDNYLREESDQWGFGARLPDATLLRTDLPVLVVRCGQDSSLNLGSTDHFIGLAEDAGVPLTLVRFDEGSHIFDWSETSSGEVRVRAVEIVKQTLEFMKAHVSDQ